MTMPRALRRSPKAFYTAAALWIIWSLVLPYIQINATGFSPQLSEDVQAAKFVMLEYVGRAVLDATFIAGVGINAHILIFIFDRMTSETRA